MKTFGKTIKIYLIDGDPNGRMSCELSNWSGKAYKLPRKLIKESANRPDLDNTGVYILFGRTDNIEEKDLAYIGEAEGIRNRLENHLAQKDFWNEAITFISKDNNLNKAHVKYLESRLYEIAKDTDRYNLTNSNSPTKSSISESDQSEMEEFIENIKLLVNSLGFKIFEPLRKVSINKEEEEKNTFYIKAARGANATGQSTSDGFVVFKDSAIADSTTNSFPQNWEKLRSTLIKNKIIEQNVFTKDYLFSSPSSAAAIVMGRSANGLTEWKTEDGRILKSIESNN
nr:GIY-YIG nuclease family protein [uncultured Bacteroides sp.]